MTTAADLDVKATFDRNGAAYVTVAGEVDLATSRFLADQLTALIEGELPIARVEIDLFGVTFIDISGIRVLEQAARATNKRGRDLRLARPSRAVTRMVDILGKTSHLALNIPNEQLLRASTR